MPEIIPRDELERITREEADLYGSQKDVYPYEDDKVMARYRQEQDLTVLKSTYYLMNLLEILYPGKFAHIHSAGQRVVSRDEGQEAKVDILISQRIEGSNEIRADHPIKEFQN